MARAARTYNGRFTRVSEYGNSNGSVGEFSRQNKDNAGKVLVNAGIGGRALDSKGNQFGHNYTTLEDGTKVATGEGKLTKRQRYYDRRRGLGMVGG